MTNKQHRQQLIVQLIASHRVSSQPELQELLRKKKVEATQATISRDLEELGAVKVRVAGGATHYVIPQDDPARLASVDQLKRVLNDWVVDVAVSANLVVIRTPVGCAHVVASALDRSGNPGLLGTVAGDDTVVCVADESTGGQRLARQLRSLAGLDQKRKGGPT